MGDLRSSMLASKVERMMLIRLNRHLIDKIRELDAAVAQARARVAKSAQKLMAAQEKRSNMSVDLTVQVPRMVMWIVSLVCLPLFSLFSAFFLCVCVCVCVCVCFVAVLGVTLRYQYLIEFRVRDHCWHACSVVGEGKYKKADSKTLY